ncbi:MAG: hypothetical protein ABSF51_13315 [Verrucomicrobiota bacterium]
MTFEDESRNEKIVRAFLFWKEQLLRMGHMPLPVCQGYLPAKLFQMAVPTIKVNAMVATATA